MSVKRRSRGFETDLKGRTGNGHGVVRIM
jgi:hypothetical protein